MLQISPQIFDKRLFLYCWITFALLKLRAKAHSHDLANPRGQQFDPRERFILTLSLIKINTRTAWSPWSQGTQHDPFLPLCPPITYWWLEVTVHLKFYPSTHTSTYSEWSSMEKMLFWVQMVYLRHLPAGANATMLTSQTMISCSFQMNIKRVFLETFWHSIFRWIKCFFSPIGMLTADILTVNLKRHHLQPFNLG